MNTTPAAKLSPTDTAKAMRAALKVAFPGTKFSLRNSRGTGWGYMDLFWTDGPAVFDVEFVLAPFRSERPSDVPDDSTVHIASGHTCKGIYMARTTS